MTETPGGAAEGRFLPDRRTLVLLGLLVAVAFVVRVDLLRNTSSPIPPAPAVSDAAAYRLLASNLADGKGYVRPFDLQRDGRSVASAEYPPGFPALLAAADLVGVSSEAGQRAVLCLVGSLTVGLVGVAGFRLGGRHAALLAAALAAAHPSLWSTDTSPLAEPLAAFLGMAVVVAALAVHQRPSRWRWVALGALAGLGGLVRAELLLVGPLLVLPLAWRLPGDHRRRLAALALGLGAMAAVLAPWTIRNAVAFGRFVPVSNNLGSVARGANCDRAYHGEFRGLWVTNVATDGGLEVDPDGRCFTGFDVTHGQDEAQSAAALRSAGLRYARDHAGELPGVALARIGRTVGLYRFDQQVNFARFEGRTARWDRNGTRLFQLLALVALAGAVVPWRRRGDGPRWVLVVPLVAVLATVVATYGNLRFRAVADPVVVVVAALAVTDAVRRFATART
ncbi:glycosyltransferase family 39 protein [Aquihabitans sp. G128]|uniref:glycosyltransferase family 39 protein n=1 Tax=Aquihabitans sp. G128 TaxID=2849779 RepID=UPI001C23C552|nr:glycosyltransferase family 39 protein [Aquihabitans sp. G128]QXC62107.1 glycosyltransferase family 39 protein [Aquihabitans sp. G128]